MKLTDLFKFKLFERKDTADLAVVNENFQTAESEIDKRLLKTAVQNTNTVTEAGYALDARQANPNIKGSLAALIDALNETLKKYLPLSGGKITGHLFVGDNVRLWSDGEGGNIRWVSPNGQIWEIDALYNEHTRLFTYGSASNGNKVLGFNFFEDGTFEATKLKAQNFIGMQTLTRTINVQPSPNHGQTKITFDDVFSETPAVFASPSYGSVMLSVSNVTNTGFVCTAQGNGMFDISVTFLAVGN